MPTRSAGAPGPWRTYWGPTAYYALVNNAGVTYTSPFETADVERGRAVLETNLLAPFTVTQALLPLLRAHNHGVGPRSRVINIGSWAGSMASPFIPFYNASKAGLAGLTESMYYDLKLLGVHAVLAVPGVSKTPLLEKTTADGLASLAKMTPASRARYGAHLDRLAEVGRASAGSRMMANPEKVAARLFKIVETRSPRLKYSLSMDARIVENVLTKVVPWSIRARATARLYQLPTGHGTPGPTRHQIDHAARHAVSTNEEERAL